MCGCGGAVGGGWGWRGVLVFLLLLLSHPVDASFQWLQLAASGALSATPPKRAGERGLSTRDLFRGCDLMPLSKVQQHVCSRYPFAMVPVSNGARTAVEECRWQFKFERWNCTAAPLMNETESEMFGATVRMANKETAFISAISSAGVVHSVTKACSSGELTDCGCHTMPNKQQYDDPSGEGKWKWGGCSDDVAYGVRFAKKFLDKEQQIRVNGKTNVNSLMNLHNHKVGRETIMTVMRKQCRCHGASGSCEFKTCWRLMPKFNEVGERIKSRYDHFSVQVARRVKRKLKRRERSERKNPIRDNELVFVNKSPNYCERNDELGILGTEGRQCNKTSYGSDSCDILCCGRGYNTNIVEVSERCQCKFVWCCHVKCKTCHTEVEVTTCK